MHDLNGIRTRDLGPRGHWIGRCFLLLVFIYLYFICGVFNDAFSSSDCVTSNDTVIVNTEWEGKWKESVVV
jgi:hypothetical protein